MSYERKFDLKPGNLVSPSFYLELALMVPNSIPRGRRLDMRLGELVTRLLKDLTLFLVQGRLKIILSSKHTHGNKIVKIVCLYVKNTNDLTEIH